jgi:Cd2+/Zn2+-exporting ATPase
VADREKAAANPDALKAESRVFAGSINGSGSLDIEVTKLSGETTLARVVTMVSEAETRQSPTQSFTKKFERIFVPCVIVLAVVTSLAFLVLDETASESFYRAMAVLVAASPCALAIATPSAILSGVARAARGGVLIKGGAPLEALGRLDAIAFDKTGTLTEGEPRLVDIVPFGDVDEDTLLRVSAAVETLSDHPLAEAVVRDAKRRLGSIPDSATDFTSITGRGVSAMYDGQIVHIGKSALFDEVDGKPVPEDLAERVNSLSADGRTTMIVRHGERYLGVIGLMDTPREAAKSVIARLRDIGVTRMMMISGDNQNVADAVARDVGLDEAFGDLMPDDKVTKIKSLKQGRGVAMVGDGVNDAPAMANATVGIAMGAAGSDVALETADIALMADDLETLPFAVGLSRATSRIIRQNLWASLGIVAFLIPATLFGLGIGPAVLIHEGSTLIVVFNALRLLAFQDREH